MIDGERMPTVEPIKVEAHRALLRIFVAPSVSKL